MKTAKPRLWVINAADNVATVIGADIDGPTEVEIVGVRKGSLLITQGVPYGHKVALVDLAAGTHVTKYGATIGSLVAMVSAGEHVHVQNLQSLRGRGDLEMRALSSPL